MSNMEINKGLLRPSNMNDYQVCVYMWEEEPDIRKFYEDFSEMCEYFLDHVEDINMRKFNGEWYTLLKHETHGESEFTVLNYEKNGNISFLTNHHNGGGSWEENIEEQMSKDSC